MKKVSYLLAVLMTMTVFTFTSCDKEDDDQKPIIDNIHPVAFIGAWKNDSTTIDNKRDNVVMQYTVELSNSASNYSAKFTRNNDGDRDNFTKWTVVDNTLTLSGNADYDGDKKDFIIDSMPSGNKMVLRLDIPKNNIIRIYRYYLSK